MLLYEIQSTDSLLTVILGATMEEKPIFMRSFMVVQAGLFAVKTGIYMPNNFNGLDRRPIS